MKGKDKKKSEGGGSGKERTGKEKRGEERRREERKEEYLYNTIYYACIVSKRSDMDHTVLRANYIMPVFLRKCSPDGASPDLR